VKIILQLAVLEYLGKVTLAETMAVQVGQIIIALVAAVLELLD
jgi:hypothetical protein